MPEVARALGISLPTAEPYWTTARTWLFAESQDEQPAQHPDGGGEAEEWHVSSHGLRLLEDARADDGADDDGGGHKRPQCADETRFGGGRLVVHVRPCKRWRRPREM